MTLTLHRDKLGQFCGIDAIRSVIEGMQEALGEKATSVSLIAAGRLHGKKLAQDLGLKGATQSLEDATKQLSQVLGADGSRLCLIDKIVQEGDVIKVYTSETLCAVGGTEELPPMCTFTLGLIWGFLTELMNQKLRGTHTESVLRGGTCDLFEFSPL